MSYSKEYFLKKLGNVEADIYSYTYIDPKTKFSIFFRIQSKYDKTIIVQFLFFLLKEIGSAPWPEGVV